MTSKVLLSLSAYEDDFCPVLCNVQALGQGWAGPACCVLVTQAPHPKETLGASEGSCQKASRGRVGLGMGRVTPASAPGSKGTKETGKKDASGTSFAFVKIYL